MARSESRSAADRSRWGFRLVVAGSLVGLACLVGSALLVIGAEPRGCNADLLWQAEAPTQTVAAADCSPDLEEPFVRAAG